VSDYYNTLGLAKSASADEIKKAYRKLALQYHPDRNAGDKAAEEKFKKISEAYAVLSDDEKRRQYDTFGSSDFHQRYSQDDIFRGADFESIFSDLGFGGRGGGGSAFESIFGRMFGGGGGHHHQRQMKGQDFEYELTIGFEEAYHGCTRQLTFRRPDNSQSDIKVSIPAGVNDGGKLRLAGKGGPAHGGGQAGDLFVIIKVATHPLYQRQGRDIEGKVAIKLTAALLGTTTEVQTLEGVRRVKVPAGVKPGTKLRLKELGFPDPQKRAPRGDFFAVIDVIIPSQLSEQQHSLVEELQKAGL
jgi:curved DNA-binding protein